MKTAVISCLVVLALVTSAEAEPDDWMIDPDPARVGEVLRVTFRLPPGVKTGTVTFGGYTVSGFETGGLLSAYVGVDLDTTPGRHDVAYRAGELAGTESVTVEDREFATESMTVDPDYVEFDDADKTRVAREAETLTTLWQGASESRLWTKGFVQPAAGGIGSPFGLRRVFHGAPRSRHSGIDILAPEGAGVFASNRGRVVLADELLHTGNTVIIDHGLGLYTVYAHLATMDVATGGAVERAQKIGTVGATGRVAGPHLHWEVRAAGARVDPMTLPGMPRP